jgi:hypothetical protein
MTGDASRNTADRLVAFGLTCVLMAAWIWTPLGGWVIDLFQLCGALAAQTHRD